MEDDIAQKLAELKQRIQNYGDKSQENMNYQLDPNKVIADKKSEMRNFPQDDVNNVISSLKNDSNADRDMLMSAGVMSGGLRNLAAPQTAKYGQMLVSKYGGPVKDLAEEYLPKAVSNKVTDFYHAAKSADNIAKSQNAFNDGERIKQLTQMAEQKPVFEAPIDPIHKPFDLDKFQRGIDMDKKLAEIAETEKATKDVLRQNIPASSNESTVALNTTTKKTGTK